METFCAEELFRIIEVSQNFPLNLKFELKDFNTSFNFANRIIYSILFDGKIIYIGYSYEDKQKDIRKSRWTKQLETILFRGYRVGLNLTSFKEFEKSLKHKIEKQCHSNITVKKKDVMTSVNRIVFATKNWNEIKAISSKNDSLLKRISFQIEVSSKSIQKQDLQVKAKELIKHRKPRCNG
jgi:hypothetical protein